MSASPSPPDHRRLGRELGIFATEAQCGAGLPFWLPAGAAVRAALIDYIVALEIRHGYAHVSTPVMAKRELYERSGHWEHYHDDMYPPMRVAGESLVLRPMLCPHHILLYAARPRSWRELPVRIAEVGAMFRHERSGVVGGLSRVRQMTLTDGHVFCAAAQVAEEIVDNLAMVREAYAALHLPPPRLRLSLPGDGAKHAASRELWRTGEAMIRRALARIDAPFSEAPGHAAFYGPKLDLQVRDPRGREETLSTIQVDGLLPERFGLRYAPGEPGADRPVIVHRSVIGSLERMVAHLLEVHDGSLPVWLSPVQVLVVPVGERALAYARVVRDRLARDGRRVELDARDETLAARIRDAAPRRIPCVVIVGEREAAAGSVSLRLRGAGELRDLPLATLAGHLGRAVDGRARELGEVS